MKHILPLIMVLMTSLGCMSQVTKPIDAPPSAVQKYSPGYYEKQAWRHFRAADYSRALQMAYRATAVAPEAPGPPLITGLIYDQVFDRPDLALIEYDRLLRLTPDRPEFIPLHLRLRHLFRRAQIQSATESIKSGAVPPLQGHSLALFPFHVWGDNKTHRELADGLTDLIAFDLTQIMGPENFPVLRLHALSKIYAQTYPQNRSSDFAQWSGATYTLTGEIAPQDGRLVVVSARLIDAMGETALALPRVVLGPGDVPQFRRILLSEIALHLGLTLPASFEPQPVTSLIALGLHARGLHAYLSNDLAQAQYFFKGALAVDKDAPLSTSRLGWINDDLEGAQYIDQLPNLYQQLLTRPLPKLALQRRLNATHTLLVPVQGIESGVETLSPYKPPQPGGTQ